MQIGWGWGWGWGLDLESVTDGETNGKSGGKFDSEFADESNINGLLEGKGKPCFFSHQKRWFLGNIYRKLWTFNLWCCLKSCNAWLVGYHPPKKWGVLGYRILIPRLLSSELILTRTKYWKWPMSEENWWIPSVEAVCWSRMGIKNWTSGKHEYIYIYTTLIVVQSNKQKTKWTLSF